MRSSVSIAVIIAIVAVIWVASGVLGGQPPEKEQNQADSAQAGQSEKLTEVRVRDLTAQPMVDNIIVTGRSRASRHVDLKAETDGEVIEILIEKGAHVKEGDIIAKLEVRDREARVREAQQLLAQRQIQFDASKALENKGFNSRVRLAEAQAQLEAARSQLKQAKVDLSKTDIKAPFDGIVNDQFIEIGDFLSKGDNVFSIVDMEPMEIVGFLTEKQVVSAGDAGRAKVTFLNDVSITGKVTYLSPVADPQTRTFEIEISVTNPEYAIKEGLTAKIEIPLAEKPAHKISPSILALADDGTIGIKTVDSSNVVQFVPVTLLKDTPEHLWVDGLPEKARVITVGQDFVIPGQTVVPVTATGDGLL